MKFKLERKEILPWVLIIIIVLGALLAFDKKIISTNLIFENDKLFSSANNIIASIVLIAASLVSYLRFFKGRLFKPKMVLRLNAGVIELEEKNLHWLDLEIENKGSVRIWHYTVEVSADCHTDESSRFIVENLHSLNHSARDKEHIIEPGEVAYEHATATIPKDIEVVTYSIVVTDARGGKWDRCITVPNRPGAS